MTTDLPIVPCVLLAAPLAVAGAAFLGPAAAGAAAFSAAVVLVNLWSLSVLGPRLVASIASDDGQAWLWAAALCAKFVLLLALYAGMARVLSPAGLAIGLVPLPLGTLLAALAAARAPPATLDGADSATSRRISTWRPPLRGRP
jgi:hypothetical protein